MYLRIWRNNILLLQRWLENMVLSEFLPWNGDQQCSEHPKQGDFEKVPEFNCSAGKIGKI